MKKYVYPVTEIIVLSTEAVLELGIGSQPGEDEFSNRNTFEEDLSAEYPMNKSLWED